jgi:hypothetical protein
MRGAVAYVGAASRVIASLIADISVDRRSDPVAACTETVWTKIILERRMYLREVDISVI